MKGFQIFLFTFIMLSTTTLLSQKITETLSKKIISPITVELIKSSEPDREPLYFVFMVFQNAKYTTITATEIVAIASDEEMKQFISDLENVVKYMQSGETGKNITYEQKNYTLEIVDFSKNVYLFDTKSRGYCQLNKKSAENLLEYVRTIKFEG